MGAAPNADCPAPICTTKDHPLVQVGGGSKRVPYSTRSEPPSVLHVRADCGGRLFAAKLHVDLPHQLLNHLLADDSILLAFICLSGIDLV
jgi:hypothetical protein